MDRFPFLKSSCREEKKRNPTNAYLTRNILGDGQKQKGFLENAPDHESCHRCQQFCSSQDKAPRTRTDNRAFISRATAPSGTTPRPGGRAQAARAALRHRLRGALRSGPALPRPGSYIQFLQGCKGPRACVRRGASRGLAPCPSGRSFLGRAAAPLPSRVRARPARGPAHAPHLVYPARRGAAASGRQVSPHAQESGPRWAAARWRLRPPFAREPPSSEHPKQSPAPPPN